MYSQFDTSWADIVDPEDIAEHRSALDEYAQKTYVRKTFEDWYPV